jgi:hypothetical protein
MSGLGPNRAVKSLERSRFVVIDEREDLGVE